MLTAVVEGSVIDINHLEMFLRLACALLIGAVIGTEREYTHRPAGLRTHILVSVGSCAVMITSQMIFVRYLPFGITADPARLSAQVISGVGFLGAGTIMREGLTVKGLTTAASLWTVACLGIAAGAGFYDLAIMGMLFAFIALTFFEWLQHRLPGNKRYIYDLAVECTDLGVAMDKINRAGETFHGRVQHQKLVENDGIFTIYFRVDFNGRRADKHFHNFLSEVSCASGVRCVQNV